MTGCFSADPCLFSAAIAVLQDFLNQIPDRAPADPVPRAEAEFCFLAGNHAWEQLRRLVQDYTFTDPACEIVFFRYLKPAITSELEYYCLLSQAALFCPESAAEARNYWLHESARCTEKLELHAGFLQYCRSGQHELDDQYFLRRAHPGNFSEKVRTYAYFDDPRSGTPGDALLALLNALLRYQHYTRMRLQALAL